MSKEETKQLLDTYKVEVQSVSKQSYKELVIKLIEKKILHQENP